MGREFINCTKKPKKMKNYELTVGIVTGILILFVALIQLEVSLFLIWVIFLAGPFLVLWMVYSVLTAPVDIKETFEDQWYQDRPDMRRI
jgi:fatty acid desaturase